MSGLIPIVILGTLILVLGGQLMVRWKRGQEPTITRADYSMASGLLDSIFAETIATKRIFAIEDMEFISRAGPSDVQRFFVKERSALAREWLRTVQKQVAHIMDLHLRLASYTYEPSAKFEFGLTVRYLWFILASDVLLILIWLRGPFEAVRITGYTLDVAEHFCAAFRVRLREIDLAKLGPAS